jgi:hypothetical protein
MDEVAQALVVTQAFEKRCFCFLPTRGAGAKAGCQACVFTPITFARMGLHQIPEAGDAT